jgi:hypothetical protein
MPPPLALPPSTPMAWFVCTLLPVSCRELAEKMPPPLAPPLSKLLMPVTVLSLTVVVLRVRGPEE